MSKLKVLHLVGSAVSDLYSDLSRLYARDCLENTANPDRYEFQIAYISPDKTWRFPTSLSQEAIAAAPTLSLPQAIEVLVDLHIDVMVPQMFCIPGMTQYRNLFDLLNIPYVGNPADLMALVADKAKTRAVVAAAGVDVPPGAVLHAGERPSIDFPLVIKPLDTDNSIGVSLVRDAADWDIALQTALMHGDSVQRLAPVGFPDHGSGSLRSGLPTMEERQDSKTRQKTLRDRVLVEKFIELGREVRCGIIDRAGELMCLPLEEYALDAKTRPIRSYADKLKQNEAGDLDFAAKDSSKSWIVDPSDPITKSVWEMARKSHIALGCRHYSLFDFRIDPQGNPWFLEAGLYCSFAETSVLSAMAKAAGISLETFFQDMLQAAIDDRL
jgi:D-alanine-D-alanine ligase